MEGFLFIIIYLIRGSMRAWVEGEGKQEQERERIFIRLHAQHGSQCGAQSIDPHHDLSRNWEPDMSPMESLRCPKDFVKWFLKPSTRDDLLLSLTSFSTSARYDPCGSRKHQSQHLGQRKERAGPECLLLPSEMLSWNKFPLKKSLPFTKASADLLPIQWPDQSPYLQRTGIFETTVRKHLRQEM